MVARLKVIRNGYGQTFGCWIKGIGHGYAVHKVHIWPNRKAVAGPILRNEQPDYFNKMVMAGRRCMHKISQWPATQQTAGPLYAGNFFNGRLHSQSSSTVVVMARPTVLWIWLWQWPAAYCTLSGHGKRPGLAQQPVASHNLCQHLMLYIKKESTPNKKQSNYWLLSLAW